ncbi:hypothetical protein F4780DRAFT_762655 [Xylariomycetidae sp. FL0641]|nr:hypothetical protein F4780DRAFT_762655 [Xylariomycetidae sp. FL0641]
MWRYMSIRGYIRCLPSLIPVLLDHVCVACLKTCDQVVLDLRAQRQVKRKKLPKSKPLAVLPTGERPQVLGKRTSFLHLPLEVRRQIYQLAFNTPAIVQVEPLFPHWSRPPADWAEGQRIRRDADPPSRTLFRIVGLGGSGLRQLATRSSSSHHPRHRHGHCSSPGGVHSCALAGAVTRLICGEQTHDFPGWVEGANFVFASDLMRACRRVYADALDVLYADTTISLFGAEMVRYFLRNASPEGLCRVRFVHVALILSSKRWASPGRRRAVERTVRALRRSLPSLCQLDLEIVLRWSQPENPQKLWAWLMTDVLAYLHGLDDFVLKVVVYPRALYSLESSFALRNPSGTESTVNCMWPLDTWDQAQYEREKSRITTAKVVDQL